MYACIYCRFPKHWLDVYYGTLLGTSYVFSTLLAFPHPLTRQSHRTSTSPQPGQKLLHCSAVYASSLAPMLPTTSLEMVRTSERSASNCLSDGSPSFRRCHSRSIIPAMSTENLWYTRLALISANCWQYEKTATRNRKSSIFNRDKAVRKPFHRSIRPLERN